MTTTPRLVEVGSPEWKLKELIDGEDLVGALAFNEEIAKANPFDAERERSFIDIFRRDALDKLTDAVRQWERAKREAPKPKLIRRLIAVPERPAQNIATDKRPPDTEVASNVSGNAAKPEPASEAEPVAAGALTVIEAAKPRPVPETPEEQAVREMNDKHAVISNLRELAKVFGVISKCSFMAPHGLQIYSTEHLTGKHNQHLQNKLFLYLDEALWGGDRQAERVLKGLVTEKSMLIEPKNINAFPWPNRLGIYMSGNDKWIVPASHDERRYAVNKVSERWKQNKSYFAPLFAEINDGGAGAMLYDMLHLDLDGWHPRENVPQTKALLDQKMLGLGGLELWYVHLLNVGELPWPDKKNPRFVISKNLLEAAKNHNARNKYTTAEELAGFLKEMGCTHKSNGKNWGWIFPPLADAREAWQIRAGGDWEWLTPDIADWAEKPAEGTD